MQWDFTVKVTDVAIGVATLLGPILAVQAQRIVDLARQRHEARLRVFGILMTTRATPTSGQHVEALNAIALVFHPQWWEMRAARRRLNAIDEAWRTLLHHFGVDQAGFTEAQSVRWIEKRQTLETELLKQMGAHLGYKIAALDYETQIYFPLAHGNELSENAAIRTGLVKILAGEDAIPVKIKNDESQEGAAVRNALGDLLSGKSALRVDVGGVPSTDPATQNGRG